MPTKLIKANDQIANLVTNKYTAAKNFQLPLYNNFIEYYKLYRSVRDNTRQHYAGRAKLFVPYIYQTIETIMPRLVGGKPKIESIPREMTDIESASVMTKLTDYQWDMMNMKKKVKDWVKQGLLYGVGFLKLTWKYEGETGYDGPCAEVCDVFDIFVDPDATTLSDAKYIIHRVERNIAELKANPKYKIPDELSADVQKDQYKVLRDAVQGLSKPNDKDSKCVEVFEYWGKYDINGDGIEKECLICVANRKYVIRLDENPYEHKRKPFISFVDTQMPNEFWAIGEVEPLKNLQYELNDIRNQRMDNVTLILNRMWKVNKNGDVDEADLVSQAGGIVHVGDNNALEVIQTPDVTASSYNEETLVKADMQQASGVTDYTKGSSAGGKGNSALANETATGIMLLQEAGNARFKFKLDNLEDSLKEFGEQLNALNQQFIKKPMVIRIVGEEGTQWKQVSPKEIKGQFDIMVEAGSTQPMSKSVRRAEARELLMTLIPIAQVAGINLRYLIKYLLKTYDLADSEEIFIQAIPTTVPGPEQAMAAMAGAQGAAFGGLGAATSNVPQQRMGGSEIPTGEEIQQSQTGAY